MANEWPKLDPLTNRKICQSCWNGTHFRKLVARPKDRAGNRYDVFRRVATLSAGEHACDSACFCTHCDEADPKADNRKRAEARKKAKADRDAAFGQQPPEGT